MIRERWAGVVTVEFRPTVIGQTERQVALMTDRFTWYSSMTKE